MKILNKIIGSSIAVAAALAFSASTTQAQNLINPSFENSGAGNFTANPITPSTVNQGWANFGIVSQTNMFNSPIASPQSGTYALLEVNAVGNNWNPAGSYQIDSGAIAGSRYTFSSYFLTDTGVAHYGTPVALQLSFLSLSSSNTFINLGTVESGAGTNAGGFTGTLPLNNTWYQGSISGTAPIGAQYVEVYTMFMDNGQTTPENVYFDNASLTMVVPEPASLALVGMGLASFYLIRRRKS
jgi:hypothetical protein